MINQLILTGNLGNDPEIFFGSRAISNIIFPGIQIRPGKTVLDQMRLLSTRMPRSLKNISIPVPVSLLLVALIRVSGKPMKAKPQQLRNDRQQH
jgi:hypothetical protein